MFIINSIGAMLMLNGIIILQMQASQNSTLEEKLLAYQWQRRVILVIALAEGETDFIEQQKRMESQLAEGKDRDLEILYMPLNKTSVADKTFLRKKYEILDQKFCIILIGKDGGEKLRSYKPLQAEELFQTIDAMPMRQQEMRSRNK